MHRFLFPLATLSLTLALFSGCGPSGPVYYKVTGKVTFNGAPVEEGVVAYENFEKGYANSAKLGAGGEYELTAPEGEYVVTILPIEVEVSAGPDSPPTTEYKDVDNIPMKYHASDMSGFSAAVTADETKNKFDFDMQP